MSKKKSLKPTKSLKDSEEVLTPDYIGGDALDDLLSKLLRSVEVAKASRGGLPEKIWMKVLLSSLCQILPLLSVVCSSELEILFFFSFAFMIFLLQQQFAIGVNDVTRVLERMPAASARTHSTHSSSETQTVSGRHRAPFVPLQAVLVAADCNPKWLTKHIPTLASTRQVPVLYLKDNKAGSLRLGQVMNVRTALAIGVKARDSIVNKTIDDVLNCGSKVVAAEP